MLLLTVTQCQTFMCTWQLKASLFFIMWTHTCQMHTCRRACACRRICSEMWRFVWITLHAQTCRYCNKLSISITIIFVAVRFWTISWSFNNQIIFPCCRPNEDKPLLVLKKKAGKTVWNSLIKNSVHSSVLTRPDNKRGGPASADCLLRVGGSSYSD